MKHKLPIALFIAYLFLVVANTILSRPYSVDVQVNMLPFWSYATIIEGGYKGTDIFYEVLLNVLLFVPIGFILPSFVSEDRRLGKSVVIGIGISVLIETTQLITHRGLFECDDIIHNSVGVLIGCGLFVILLRIVGFINTLCEIVTNGDRNWMHLISSGTHWEGLRQDINKRSGFTEYAELHAGCSYVLTFTAYGIGDSVGKDFDFGIHNCSSDGTIQEQYWTPRCVLSAEPTVYEFHFKPTLNGWFRIMIGTGLEYMIEAYYSNVKIVKE